jgi:hypothetical protein
MYPQIQDGDPVFKEGMFAALAPEASFPVIIGKF